MNAWTDYPKPELKYDGVLRKVDIVAFDCDKYVTTSEGEYIKAGYIYRTRRKRPFLLRTLERNLPHEH